MLSKDLGHLCVFAKPPLAGEAKTRLIPALGASGAAALARACLLDTWRGLQGLPARRVLACTAEEVGVPELGAAEHWLQGPGPLEARLERIFQRGLGVGPWVIALGADSPGLPRPQLEAAIDALEHHDAVLGPADDGGFYLLGLRRFPSGLLDGVAWSTAKTLEQTQARLEAAGLRPALLEPWFDVDEPADVERLAGLLAAGTIDAPECKRLLLGAS